MRTLDVMPTVTNRLAVAMACTTFGLLAVMVAVRTTDPAGGVAIGLGLGITAGVGATVAARRPDHPSGWLLAALPAFAAAAVAATDYVQNSLAGAAPWPGTELVAWGTTWLALPAVPVGVLLLVTFPTGRLPSAREITARRLPEGVVMGGCPA